MHLRKNSLYWFHWMSLKQILWILTILVRNFLNRSYIFSQLLKIFFGNFKACLKSKTTQYTIMNECSRNQSGKSKCYNYYNRLLINRQYVFAYFFKNHNLGLLFANILLIFDNFVSLIIHFANILMIHILYHYKFIGM